MNKDPILEALARIEAKQDLSLQNQEQMEADIQQISQDTKKTAAIVGAVSGAVSGGIVSTGIALFRAKRGV